MTIAAAGQCSAAPRRRRTTWQQIRRMPWPYLFITPFFLLFGIFELYPYVYAFFLSFQDWDGIGQAKWVGLDNYSRLAEDGVWWKSLYNSVWLTLASLLNLVIALVLAFLLNSGLVRMRQLFRVAYFLPVVASSVAVALVFTTMYGSQYGTYNYLLSFFGLGPVDWLGNAAAIKPAIANVVIWRAFGFNVVVYLAGLQAIPSDLYEAAKLDGAGTLRIAWSITMPMITPTLFFLIVVDTIHALQSFGQIHLLTKGGPTGHTTTLVYWIYHTAFANGASDYGTGSAQAIVLLAVVIAVTVIQFGVLERKVFYR